MKTSEVPLLDVSVLIALLDDGHMHHDAAHRWFADRIGREWASCPITENGVVRILSNATRVDHPFSVPTLVHALGTLREQGQHRFWSEDLSICDTDRFAVEAIRGHQQITDIYLLALAVKNGGRLVTFDQRVPLAAVKGARPEHLEVISATS